MSDSYFIGTVSRVHNLWRFGRPTPSSSKTPEKTPEEPEKSVDPFSKFAKNPFTHITRLANLEAAENSTGRKEERRSVGMMVSLDHTIYFHRPREVVADEWMFSEMESPWAGEGRGLVMQRIWNKRGVLLASCVQEVGANSLILSNLILENVTLIAVS